MTKTVLLVPKLKLKMSPYFLDRLVNVMKGGCPLRRCRLPINGRGIGPGGKFLNEYKWLM